MEGFSVVAGIFVVVFVIWEGMLFVGGAGNGSDVCFALLALLASLLLLWGKSVLLYIFALVRSMN